MAKWIVMGHELGPLVAALVEQGKGESISSTRFFPLVTLDSGARVGLDGEARFALITADGELRTFSNEEGHVFHEVLEWKRSAFDDALEEGGKSLGLPGFDVSLAFPTTGIVRAVLQKNMHYTTRLALAWLRPTDLRELRDDIRRIAEDRYTPSTIRDLASRLIVSD